MDAREVIVRRAAQELKDGMYVNLGIGMPTMIANLIPEGMDIVVASENGLLGIGPVPNRRQGRPPTYQCWEADHHDWFRARAFSATPTVFAMIRRREYRPFRSLAGLEGLF